MKTILITDTLFIKDHHVKKLTEAGYTVERLPKSNATEEELCEAIKGKVGYILGGIEKVTEKVILSSDKLKAIVFTGTGMEDFIPANKLATTKGIAIGDAPHLNAHAVAEYGMTLSLMLCRGVLDIARNSTTHIETAKNLSELHIGIVGMGHVAKEYLGMAKGMGARHIYYFNRTRNYEIEKEFDIRYVDKNDLFQTCNLIYMAISTGPGKQFINRENIYALQKGSILVSTSGPLLFDLTALYERLENHEIRGAFDENIKEHGFTDLPLSVWYTPQESSGFNTNQAIELVSDSSVNTLLNLLKSGDDKYLLNPEYKKYIN